MEQSLEPLDLFGLSSGGLLLSDEVVLDILLLGLRTRIQLLVGNNSLCNGL